MDFFAKKKISVGRNGVRIKTTLRQWGWDILMQSNFQKLPYSLNSTKSENTLVLCLDAIRSPEHRNIGILILRPDFTKVSLFFRSMHLGENS